MPVKPDPKDGRPHRKAFPPPASSTGKRYYLFEKGCPANPMPFIACGENVALLYLGRWKQPREPGYVTGKSPPGYKSIEDALNAAADKLIRCEIEVRWSYPYPASEQEWLLPSLETEPCDVQDACKERPSALTHEP